MQLALGRTSSPVARRRRLRDWEANLGAAGKVQIDELVASVPQVQERCTAQQELTIPDLSLSKKPNLGFQRKTLSSTCLVPGAG